MLKFKKSLILNVPIIAITMGGVLLGLDQMDSVSKLNLTSKVAMQSKNSSTKALQDTIAAQSANPDLSNATSTVISAENSQVTSAALVSASNNTNAASTNTLSTNNSPQISPLTPLKPINTPLISKSKNNSDYDDDDEDDDDYEDEDEYENEGDD